MKHKLLNSSIAILIILIAIVWILPRFENKNNTMHHVDSMDHY